MTRQATLAALIAETFGADEPKLFVLCDAGNGSAFGAAGQALDYDDAAAARYGALVMRPTAPHLSADQVECAWASEWIEGDNGYRYQVRL